MAWARDVLASDAGTWTTVEYIVACTWLRLPFSEQSPLAHSAMLCRDRTSRVELASAQCRSWSEGKRPTRSCTGCSQTCCEQTASTWVVAVRPDMVHCGRTSRLSI